MSDHPTNQTTERPIKCVLDGKFLKPCLGLEQCEGRSHNGSGGGFDILPMTNLRTGQHARDLPVLYSGQHRKKGMLFNFCPFCGTELSPLFLKDAEAA